MSNSADEIDRLANYLLENWAFEIGREESESAVDVAIRLLKDYKSLLTERHEPD